MNAAVPKKDPATDSYHYITVKVNGTAVDLTTWSEGHIVHVVTEKGELIARYSDKSVTGYLSSSVVDVDGTKKIKILLKSDAHRDKSNQRLYAKVFRQVTDGAYKAKIGLELKDLDGPGVPLIDLGLAEVKTLPNLT